MHTGMEQIAYPDREFPCPQYAVGGHAVLHRQVENVQMDGLSSLAVRHADAERCSCSHCCSSFVHSVLNNPFSISTSLASKGMDASPQRKWRKSCCGVTWWRSAMKHTASSAHNSSGNSVSCFIVFSFLSDAKLRRSKEESCNHKWGKRTIFTENIQSDSLIV